MNDNKLLTGVHRGIHSPWWRTDSSWKCQSELRFPPRVSLQIYNVYCLELDRWLLQCFFWFCFVLGFFWLQDPRWNGTVLLLWSCCTASVVHSFPLFLKLFGNNTTLPVFNAKWSCLPVFLIKQRMKEKINLTQNQLSALTPPPWEIWTAAKKSNPFICR